MRWITRPLIGLLFVLLGMLCTYYIALGPWAILPGGPLRGEVVQYPMDDWSFTNSIGEIQLETRDGGLPYSVTTWCIAHAGKLYVPSRNASRKRWVANVVRNPEVRLRIGGRIYERHAVRVTDPAERDPLMPLILRKYLGIEVEEGWPIREPARRGEARASIWMFRMDPRT
jgi:hypothetical protein